ncbi:MAG: hypothetical protein K8J31_19705 [Anaerolineae bacterium]|nr:hypothetical protein [Anaerolineae bacterium]
MNTLDTLSPSAQHWTRSGIAWADTFYDPAYDLLTVPPDADAHYPPRIASAHMVRDSIWYALGLLMRQDEGDIDRALKITRAVLRDQFDEPGRVYHGTFRRAPEEPLPPPDHAVEWKDYDPNWREFICTIFLVMMREYGPLLPEDLQASLWTSMRKAAEGAFARRVPPHYTNIALMSALLLDYAGEHFDVPAWRAQGDVLARAVHAQFTHHNRTFWEYNSPTYYGVDLYALALWREYGLSETVFRAPGAEMEADLWRDIARFYHAGLRNLCGPFDRSYGMDMTHYLATVGLWIALAVPVEQAPLPDVSQVFGHSADFLFLPPAALLGARVPAEALPHLTAFQGERQLERQVEPGRTATAWLSDRVIVGASTAHFIRSGEPQFHAATMHWLTPDGAVGWMRLRTTGPVDARVDGPALTIDSLYPAVLRFELLAPGLDSSQIQAARWTLPGQTIDIEADGAAPEVTVRDGVMEVQLAVERMCTLVVR